MYVFEMKELPKSAGKAILEWDKGVKSFSRNKKRIVLPLNQRLSYFPLQEGNQFLAYLPRDERREVWFGGTDEEPFLVEMEPEVAEHFENTSAGVRRKHLAR